MLDTRGEVDLPPCPYDSCTKAKKAAFFLINFFFYGDIG